MHSDLLTKRNMNGNFSANENKELKESYFMNLKILKYEFVDNESRTVKHSLILMIVKGSLSSENKK